MTDKEIFIETYNKNIHRPGAEKLLAWLEGTDFFTAPASTRFHAAYEGGLLDHSLNDKATADKAAVQAAMAAGQSRAEALEPYVGDAAFEQWYASFCQQLQAAAESTE